MFKLFSSCYLLKLIIKIIKPEWWSNSWGLEIHSEIAQEGALQCIS